MGKGYATQSHPRQGRLIAALLIGFVASACASGVSNPLERRAVYRLAEDHRVEVTNRNWDDMQIFVAHGSAVYRLGSVSGHSSREFRLPVALAGRAGGLRLAARPRGGKSLHYSELIQLAPGQVLGWTLESNLRLSFHWVR
ncbi:MAG: hypothetical protein HKN73_18050 [Gemmatimonadetes bacterium]|nr:hypothetical protein [Gemmatimonadota bacterium]